MHPSLIDAKQFYENGNYGEAARLYRATLEIDTNNAFAHQGLAQCLIKLNKYEEAMAEARKAIEIDQTVAISHFILAYIYSLQHNFVQSEIEARRTIELDPQLVAAYMILSTLEENKKHIQESIEAVQKAIQINPNISTGYIALGRLQRKLKNFEESKTALQEAIRLDPKNWRAYYQLAIVYIRSRPKYLAIKYLWAALRIHPALVFDLMQVLEGVLFGLLGIIYLIITFLQPVLSLTKAIFLPLLFFMIGESLLAMVFDVKKSGLKSHYMKNIIVFRILTVFFFFVSWSLMGFIFKH